ncbi:MAG: SCO family protein [Fimbriimonadales bacterium]|nr:SCO family protein [Fimbriimonadales bacterium]
MVRRACCTASLCLLISGLGVGWGQTPLPGVDLDMPAEEAYLYRRVPDVVVRLTNGKRTRLSQLWANRPQLLVPVFARCTGICSPLLISLRETTEIVGGAGEEYDVLVVSFDPQETPEQLEQFVHRSGLPSSKGWRFAAGEPDTLPQLLNAIGFWHRRVEGTDQYDHPGMIVAVAQGRVMRLHIGGAISPPALRALLREVRGDRVLSYPLPDAQLMFRCYRYDPRTGEARADWGMLAIWLPSIVGMSSAVILFIISHKVQGG